MRIYSMIACIALLYASHGVRARDHGDPNGDHGATRQYTVVTIDYPGFRGTTTVDGINSAGRIVGGFTVPSTQFAFGFTEFRSVFSLLPSAPCASAHCDTTPLAINSRGDIAGEFSDNIAHRAVFVIRLGTLHLIDIPNSSEVALLGGLNERGDVVGFFQTTTGVVRTFLYVGSTLTELAVPPGVIDMAGRAITNSGQIAGNFDDARGVHGFIETRGTFARIDVPGGLDTTPVAINNGSDVTGNYSMPSKTGALIQRGFLFSRGRLSNIDFPGGLNTLPTALTDSGTIVGTYVNPAQAAPFNTNAFVFQRGKFIRLPLPGAALSVTGVSPSGEVVGTYFDPGCPVSCSVHGFFATPGEDKHNGD
jgi:hypothetical protein